MKNKNVYYFSYFLLFFLFNILQANEYVGNEIIVKFKEGYLSNTFLNSDGEFLKTKNSLILSKIPQEERDRFSFFINDSVGNRTEIRKVARKFMLKDSNSTSRNGKKINISDILSICVIDFKEKIRNMKEICDSLSNLDFILFAEPNYIIELNDNTPNDPRFYLQKGLEQSNNIDIDANRAWDFTTGNSGIKVGVIDNGIDYHNEDLGDGIFGVSGAKVRGGWDYINNDSDPDYTENMDCSHGTEVAGIIGAYRNNDLGIAGLAGGDGGSNSGCQLFALKIGPTTCSDGSCKCIDLSKAIEAIIDGSTSSPGYGCHILNNSWGGYFVSDALEIAVRIASQNNVVFIASKGNNNSSNYHSPSDINHEWIISVGASDSFDEKASFSNTGNGIDVVAPGTSSLINTTTTVENGDYSTFNGTSASAPVVSGLAALILSEALEQNRTLHVNDVEGIICSSAEDVNYSTDPGYDDYIGHGRINAGYALEMMNKPWEMNYHSVTGGELYDSTSWNYNFYLFNPGGGLSTGTYQAKKIEVRKTITLPNYLNDCFIWTRTVNESVGWSQANPNHQLGYSEILSRDGNQVTMRTFIYRLYNSLGQYIGYRPTTHDNVVFEYTTLGIPCYEDVHLVETFSKNLDNNTTKISASNNITASNIIESNADVHYQAGNSIRLWPGVHIKEGSEFRANIDNCDETTYSKINLTKNEEVIEYKKPSMLKLAPNPTSGNTIATVEIGEKSICSLTLMDNLGNEVVTIFKDKELAPGKYQYDLEANNLSNGIYLCVLRIGSSMHSEKLVYLK